MELVVSLGAVGPLPALVRFKYIYLQYIIEGLCPAKFRLKSAEKTGLLHPTKKRQGITRLPVAVRSHIIVAINDRRKNYKLVLDKTFVIN
jgi:hypothetical protein